MNLPVGRKAQKLLLHTKQLDFKPEFCRMTPFFYIGEVGRQVYVHPGVSVETV